MLHSPYYISCTVCFILHIIYPVLCASLSSLQCCTIYIYIFCLQRQAKVWWSQYTEASMHVSVLFSLYQYALLYVLSHRKCYNLMMRRRKPADSTPKQSKKQPRPQTDEAGPVQARPHPSAMNKALLQRKGTRRVKGKSAVQLRWQVCSILLLT